MKHLLLRQVDYVTLIYKQTQVKKEKNKDIWCEFICMSMFSVILYQIPYSPRFQEHLPNEIKKQMEMV